MKVDMSGQQALRLTPQVSNANLININTSS